VAAVVVVAADALVGEDEDEDFDELPQPASRTAASTTSTTK